MAVDSLAKRRAVAHLKRGARGATAGTTGTLLGRSALAWNYATLEPPPQTCPECGAAMVFNDFPERYFSFLS